MKTLKEFLIKTKACNDGFDFKTKACNDGFDFAKDLTLEQFLNTCPRGDWILWLFAKTNPDSLRELTLVKGHCANTVRHLMKDPRSIKAVDVAIAFGEGRATIGELEATYAATYAASIAYFADAASWVSNPAYAASIASGYGARKANQKLTADICRQFLPLQIWNQID